MFVWVSEVQCSTVMINNVGFGRSDCFEYAFVEWKLWENWKRSEFGL